MVFNTQLYFLNIHSTVVLPLDPALMQYIIIIRQGNYLKSIITALLYLSTCGSLYINVHH